MTEEQRYLKVACVPTTEEQRRALASDGSTTLGDVTAYRSLPEAVERAPLALDNLETVCIPVTEEQARELYWNGSDDLGDVTAYRSLPVALGQTDGVLTAGVLDYGEGGEGGE